MKIQEKLSRHGSITALFGIIAFMFFAINTASAKEKRVLIFCKTAGYHHESIAAGVKTIEKLGAENNFDVDSTTDSRKFTYDNLKRYAAVIFLSTTHDVLDEAQQKQFIKYIESGGGFVGVHAATDCEYNWQWYGNLVGAYFDSHPAQQDAVLDVQDTTNISTKHLPRKWKRFDEWYNLLTIDESSYTGGKNPGFHPMAWYHTYDGGRAFYTELGHTNESYADPLYLKHLLGGIEYAMGTEK
jgi:type 1 glutamine amidotransferase